MPYINKQQRINFVEILKEIEEKFEKDGITPGELNYFITKIVHTYIQTRGLSYTYINDIVGVLDCVKAEFQRRIVNGYEDVKIFENGDV